VRVTPDCDSINSFSICYAESSQYAPDIVYGADNYFVSWTDKRYGFYNIFGARVTANGTVLDTNGFPIGPINATKQWQPSIAFTGNQFFVIWGYNTSPCAITGRFVDLNGIPGTDTVHIATADGSVWNTRLVFDGTNFFAIWIEACTSTGFYKVKGQLVSGAGFPIGNTILIADSVHFYNSLGLRYNSQHYIVTYSKWTNNIHQVFGRFYNTSGQPIGSQFRISNSAFDCYYGDLTPGVDSHYLNVWSENRAFYDIYGNVDIIFGIEELIEKPLYGVRMQSNIITKNLKLLNTCGEKVKIFDSSGKLIGFTQDGAFDCSWLSAGIYFLVTSNGQKFKVIKINQ